MENGLGEAAQLALAQCAEVLYRLEHYQDRRGVYTFDSIEAERINGILAEFEQQTLETAADIEARNDRQPRQCGCEECKTIGYCGATA
jgi:hypothetical protein